MPVLSTFNNSYSPLGIDGFFDGKLESTQDLVSITVNIHSDVPVRVIIRQYRQSVLETLVQENYEDVAASTKAIVQTPVKSAFFNVVVLNESGGTAAVFTQVTTYLQTSHYQNLDIRKLSATGVKRDSSLIYGLDVSTGLKHPISVDANGSLIVVQKS